MHKNMDVFRKIYFRHLHRILLYFQFVVLDIAFINKIKLFPIFLYFVLDLNIFIIQFLSIYLVKFLESNLQFWNIKKIANMFFIILILE